ncbi:MAG: AAA family ATPase, partial [Clostridia bacterium]|nr:AAA family ATPase [Clostridia bacterium]
MSKALTTRFTLLGWIFSADAGSTCASLAYAFASAGKKVLLIDGDMQLNLTLSYFSEEVALEIAGGNKNLYSAIKEQKDLADYV